MKSEKDLWNLVEKKRDPRPLIGQGPTWTRRGRIGDDAVWTSTEPNNAFERCLIK